MSAKSLWFNTIYTRAERIVFAVDFEHISRLVLMFSLLTSNMYSIAEFDHLIFQLSLD